MRQTVICYLPTKNGNRLTEYTWGMIKIAKRIAGEQCKLIGIIVHTGLDSNEIRSLPFEEVYHVKLGAKHWKVADYHIEAFQKVIERIEVSDGLYLFSSSPLYHEVAVRLSVRNYAGVITNAMELISGKNSESPLILKRELYHEKAHEFIAFNELEHKYITLDNTILYGDKQQGEPKQVQEIFIDGHLTSKIQFVSESILDWNELKITEARCVIGIGRGVYGSNSLKDIFQLAELLNAPIGGSKVADELGLIPREKRIGSSGSTIDADIYFAIGISGSSQHLEGIKGVKHVVAINHDPSAPIFQRCDIGIVGDFQAVVPKLVQSLQAERQRDTNDEHHRVG
jgi:electron transfer flavoprotein alpha subunit